jgi:hypothetical protein
MFSCWKAERDWHLPSNLGTPENDHRCIYSLCSRRPSAQVMNDLKLPSEAWTDYDPACRRNSHGLSWTPRQTPPAGTGRQRHHRRSWASTRSGYLDAADAEKCALLRSPDQQSKQKKFFVRMKKTHKDTNNRQKRKNPFASVFEKTRQPYSSLQSLRLGRSSYRRETFAPTTLMRIWRRYMWREIAFSKRITNLFPFRAVAHMFGPKYKWSVIIAPQFCDNSEPCSISQPRSSCLG